MRVYGCKISYYTGKLGSYLRYRSIDYESLPTVGNEKRLRQGAGAVQMPVATAMRKPAAIRDAFPRPGDGIILDAKCYLTGPASLNFQRVAGLQQDRVRILDSPFLGETRDAHGASSSGQTECEV